MRTFFVAFLLAFGSAAATTPALRRLALRFRLLDHPSARKVHAVAVPRIGGVALVGAFYLPLVGLFFRGTGIAALFWADEVRALALFAGGLLIAGLGIYDDLRGANARQKFAVQFLAAALMYAAGFRVEILANPFGDTQLSLGLLSLPITLLWIVGVVNAMNFVDGLDGLASGVAFFAVSTTFLIALGRGELLMCLYMATLGGAILGFLVYNFNPATIFMGDTGSMFLGFVLAVSSIQTSQKSSTAVALLIPLLALGLPIMDTLLAMVRRLWLGRPVFTADRDHIHHRLLARGFSHRGAVLLLYGVCGVLCASALVLTYANSRQVAFLLVGVGAALAVLIQWLGYLRPSTRPGAVVLNAADHRRRNHQLRATVRALGSALAGAGDLEAIWTALRPLAQPLDADRLTLEIVDGSVGGDERRTLRTWQTPDPGEETLTIRVPIRGEHSLLGELVVGWRDGRRNLDRDDEVALEWAADHLAPALEALALPANVVKIK